MKNTKKLLVCIVLITTLAFSLSAQSTSNEIAFTQEKIGKIKTGLDDLTYSLIQTAPSTVSHQNMWASGYIGQVLALPPHLGGGINVGMAQLKTDGLNSVLNELGISSGIKSLFLPTLTVDLRVGGLFIPFDIGVHGMAFQKPVTFNVSNSVFSVDFKTVGADLRIPLIKQNAVLPNLSLGFGYTYSAGNAGINANQGLAVINAGYESQILQGSLQLSKKFFFVEPFIGFRGTLSSNKRNWDWNYDGIKNVDGIPEGIEALNTSYAYKESEWSGFSPNKQHPNYTAQIYGGIGFDFLFIVQSSLNVSYDIVNNIWGGGLSLRVKI